MTVTESAPHGGLVHEGLFYRDMPVAGRLTPRHDGVSGRGLVIVHALCDLVRVHSTPAGTTVRLHIRPDGEAGS